MRAARGVAVGVVVLGIAAFASVAVAAAPVRVRRCAYVHSRYWGHVAVYPWRMSCQAARATLRESESTRSPVINFSADGAYTFDGGVLRLAGRWWVCGGRMGFYFCGYPYRPAMAHGLGGGTTYRGPFTREFVYEACADDTSLCRHRQAIFQPPRHYR